MGISSNSNFNGKDEYDGIMAGHAYTLVSVVEIKLMNERVKLLRIRNPCKYINIFIII